MNLTSRELEVMEIFWNAREPLARAELLAQLDKDSWKPPAIHAFLNNLIKKGVLRISGFYQEGRSIGRKYEAAIAREDFFLSMVDRSKTSLSKIVTAFLDDGCDEETISELEEIIRNKKQEWRMDV